MPNWCHNKLTIRSDKPELLQRYRDAFDEGKLLAALRPEPSYPGYDNNEVTPAGMPDWWEWRNANWGTKWDVGGEDGYQSGDANEVSFEFESAWRAPIEAVMHAGEAEGFEWELVYYEPGMNFGGVATEDGDECHEGVENFPRRVIEEFSGYFPEEVEDECE